MADEHAGSELVRAGRGGDVPWLSRFCETNVRTYVTAPDGSRGVWFLSLDASRLPAVVTARAGYQLPYFWSAMSYHRAGDVVAYRCRRRWPRPAPRPTCCWRCSWPSCRACSR